MARQAISSARAAIWSVVAPTTSFDCHRLRYLDAWVATSTAEGIYVFAIAKSFHCRVEIDRSACLNNNTVLCGELAYASSFDRNARLEGYGGAGESWLGVIRPGMGGDPQRRQYWLEETIQKYHSHVHRRMCVTLVQEAEPVRVIRAESKY